MAVPIMFVSTIQRLVYVRVRDELADVGTGCRNPFPLNSVPGNFCVPLASRSSAPFA
jgi:hypothetical protein